MEANNYVDYTNNYALNLLGLDGLSLWMAAGVTFAQELCDEADG